MTITTEGVTGFLAANFLPAREFKPELPKDSSQPIVITLEMLEKLHRSEDFRNRMAGYKGPALLTLEASLLLAQELSARKE